MGIVKHISDAAAYRRNERIAAESEQQRADIDLINLLMGIEEVEEEEETDDDDIDD